MSRLLDRLCELARLPLDPTESRRGLDPLSKRLVAVLGFLAGFLTLYVRL